MLRFLLLGLGVSILGLTAGLVISPDAPASRPTSAPIDIVSAHSYRATPAPSPAVRPAAGSEAPETIAEPTSSSGRVARKRKQLKERQAASAVAKPGTRTGRCSDEDDDDEC